MAGAIAVENGEIVDVGAEKDLRARYKNALREDYPGQVLLPGLINAHTHLDMTLHKDYPFDPVRSMTIDVNFVDWVMATIAHKKQTPQENLQNAVNQGLEACIEAGTTCVGDMGSYEGIFQCLEQVGIRAVIFPEVLSYDSFMAKDLYENALAIVEKYADFESERISVGIGPYSPYTLSRNILKIMAQYCKSSGLPLMMHTAESFSEMEFFYNSSGDIATLLFPNIGWGDNLPPAFGKTPIAYLDEINFFDCQPILVGCVQATREDLDRIAKKGAKIVWCPRSYDYLKVGLPPFRDILDKKIPLALGTDGISSTNTLSLWDELRFAYEMMTGGNVSVTAQDLFKMVTLHAARVLGLQDSIGSLAIGKKADYIVVDLDKKGKNESDIYLNLLSHTKTYHVRKVVVEGQTLKSVN